MTETEIRIAQNEATIKRLQEETARLRIKEHQENEEVYICKAGDIVTNFWDEERLIAEVDSRLVSIDDKGRAVSYGQVAFEVYEYKKVGTIIGFDYSIID